MSDDEYIVLQRSEVECLVQVLTPISKTHGGDYNKWMHGGGSKKGKIPLVDAHAELRKILPTLERLLVSSELESISDSEIEGAVERIMPLALELDLHAAFGGLELVLDDEIDNAEAAVIFRDLEQVETSPSE